MSQIVASMASRASRSSPPARTLISSWAVRARSISFRTASVRPLSPIRTTGRNGWAAERKSLRSREVSSNIGMLGIVR
ncbi:Uncharacterised protein [Bordetella pertussis]|nr:Uncharacterised protein [Bordetella pertussis]CFW28660.1 Uncharacterised protein [Bordetella pertussis]